jgi:hypothetical protein
MTFYVQSDSPGIQTPGKNCVHCGLPGFKHEKIKVSYGGGQWGYDYKCPEDK